MKKFLASAFLLTLSIHAMDNNTENLNLTQNTNAKSTAIVVYNQRGSEAEERSKALQARKSDSGNNKSNLLDYAKQNLLVDNKIIIRNLIIDKNGRLKLLFLQYESDIVIQCLAFLYDKIFVFNKKESELRFYPNSDTAILNFNRIAALSTRISCIHLENMETINVSLLIFRNLKELYLKNIKNISGSLSELSNLKTLSLENMETVDVSLPIFRNVKKLYLENIENISGSLSELSNLKTLSLENVNITNLDLSDLCLKKLSLINMHLGVLHVETHSLHLENSICDSFGLNIEPSLLYLSLKNTKIANNRDITFYGLTSLTLDGEECVEDGDLRNLTIFGDLLGDLDEIVIKNMKKVTIPSYFINYHTLTTLENVTEANIPENVTEKLTIIGNIKSINDSSEPIKINWEVKEIFVRNNPNEIIIEKDVDNLDLDPFSSVETVGKIKKLSCSELSKKFIEKHRDLLKNTNKLRCNWISNDLYDCPPLASIESLIIVRATKLNISNLKKILPNLKEVYLEGLKDCCIDLSSYDSLKNINFNGLSTKIIFPKGEKFQNVVSDLFRQAGLIDTTPLYLNVLEGNFEITSYFDRFSMSLALHIRGSYIFKLWSSNSLLSRSPRLLG